jgi:ParB family transcriptional regulator, chromosome partitioning protein
MSNIKKPALGKGLTALLQDNKTDITGKNTAAVNSIADINISEIEANPFQPRLEFEESALEELTESIKLHGIIQPITVRKIGNGKYEIISGERRTRASIRAGLKTIPAYVRIANDQSMLEMALIENIHRENLNAIEIALSYKRLSEECRLNQEELGERVGKNRTTVTNYLRLLKLPEEIQIALRDAQITMGHARSLINIEDKDLQLEMLYEIIDHDLSVRQIEQLVKARTSAPVNRRKAPVAGVKNGTLVEWEKRFSGLVDKTIKIKQKNNGVGEIIIPFKGEQELAKLAEFLEKKSSKN